MLKNKKQPNCQIPQETMEYRKWGTHRPNRKKMHLNHFLFPSRPTRNTLMSLTLTVSTFQCIHSMVMTINWIIILMSVTYLHTLVLGDITSFCYIFLLPFTRDWLSCLSVLPAALKLPPLFAIFSLSRIRVDSSCVSLLLSHLTILYISLNHFLQLLWMHVYFLDHSFARSCSSVLNWSLVLIPWASAIL